MIKYSQKIGDENGSHIITCTVLFDDQKALISTPEKAA